MIKKKSFSRSFSVEELKLAVKAQKKRNNKKRSLKSLIFGLFVVAAACVIISNIWIPILQVYGGSMVPTLHNGEILLAVNGSSFKSGDIVAFNYGNKILLKRVIAVAGQYVEIDEDGNVFVNGESLKEPYVYDKSLGDCDIEFPYQVPEGKIFVLGDHRSTSVDSRSYQVGDVSREQVIGKVQMRIWPLNYIGFL